MLRSVLIAVALSLAACTEEAPPSAGVYMLVDLSGAAADERTAALSTARSVLARLRSGDAFALARVDTSEFSENEVVAAAHFKDRPSVINRQKRAALSALSALEGEVPAPHPDTDVGGALETAAAYLSRKNIETRTVLLISDLDEAPRPIPALQGVQVIAINVTRFRAEGVNPRAYIEQLEAWRGAVEAAGGAFRVVNDQNRIDDNRLRAGS